MRLKRGAWEGAHARRHVLAVLTKHGVEVTQVEPDQYLLVDADGDPHVMHIPNPVPSEIIQAIYLRFGQHGFRITDLRSRKRMH